MRHELKVPRMGESISEVAIGEIFKGTGSQIKRDEEILELETNKVNQLICAPVAGMLTITVEREQLVRVGDAIGFIETDGQADSVAVDLSFKEQPAPTSIQPKMNSVRNTKEDFLTELAAAPKEAPKQEAAKSGYTTSVNERGEVRRKMTKIRKVITQRLVEAQHTAAMLTTFNEVDMTAIMALRVNYQESFQKQHGVKLGFMSFFVKACVSALQLYPAVNSFIDGDEIVTRHFYDIGVAVGTERGVIVPVVRDADRLSFAQVEKSIAGQAEKAKVGKLSLDDLEGGCFTVTNGGIYGSLLSTPILNPPQSGILGMHKIEKRPVVIDDQILIRPMMYLALSYDHRMIDGKEAVTFLVHVKNCLEEPLRLLLQI